MSEYSPVVRKTRAFFSENPLVSSYPIPYHCLESTDPSENSPMPSTDKPEIPDQLLSQWQVSLDLISELLEAPDALLTRVELPMIEVFQASQHPQGVYHQGDRVEIAGLYCEEVVQNSKPLHIEDARRSQRWREAPEVELDRVSYYGFPVQWSDGEIFGTLCILDSRPRPKDDKCSRILDQFSKMIEAHLDLLWKNTRLQQSMTEIRTLQGILPICARCKKVRNDQGYWLQVEEYISTHTDAVFSHGLCDRCESLYSAELDEPVASKHSQATGEAKLSGFSPRQKPPEPSHQAGPKPGLK